MTHSIDRAAFVARVLEARRATFGNEGVPQLAEALGIPVRTWENYEVGVAIPDTIILRFLCLTESAPLWLLSGEEPRYSSDSNSNTRFG